MNDNHSNGPLLHTGMTSQPLYLPVILHVEHISRIFSLPCIYLSHSFLLFYLNLATWRPRNCQSIIFCDHSTHTHLDPAGYAVLDPGPDVTDAVTRANYRGWSTNRARNAVFAFMLTETMLHASSLTFRPLHPLP